jgi:hypothetical protein
MPFPTEGRGHNYWCRVRFSPYALIFCMSASDTSKLA